MKNTNLTTLLALGLALTFAVTGCKHKTYKTPLDGNKNGSPTGMEQRLSPGPAIDTSSSVNSSTTPGAIGTATFNLEDYNQNRSAFAANTVHFDYDSSAVRSSEEGNISTVA